MADDYLFRPICQSPFEVDANGIHVDEDNIKIIREWKTPTTKKQIQFFLGLANYFREFVKDFAGIVHDGGSKRRLFTVGGKQVDGGRASLEGMYCQDQLSRHQGGTLQQERERF